MSGPHRTTPRIRAAAAVQEKLFLREKKCPLWNCIFRTAEGGERESRPGDNVESAELFFYRMGFKTAAAWVAPVFQPGTMVG